MIVFNNYFAAIYYRQSNIWHAVSSRHKTNQLRISFVNYYICRIYR